MFKNIHEYNKWLDDFNKRYTDKSIDSTVTDKPVITNTGDLTVVTMLHGDSYFNSFKDNFESLLTIPTFANNKLLIFYIDDRFCNNATFTKAHPNVEFVKYKYKTNNIREACLSSFIIGAAEHVTTKYMLKWDADCIKNNKYNKILINDNDYKRYDIWAKSCDISNRVSSDNINILSELDTKTFKLFKSVYNFRNLHNHLVKTVENKRWVRMQSYFCYYKMDFIREVNEFLKEYGEGRMIIPSEDTITSYYAWAKDKKVCYTEEKYIPITWKK